MALIKNLHLMKDADTETLAKMEHAAAQHGMISAIEFKLLEVSPNVVIRVIQGKSPNRNQFTQKRLSEIVKETFKEFFPGKRIDARAIPYQAPESSSVTPEWIRHKMTENGIKLKHLADETGLDYTYLSSVSNGKVELSQQMKALLFYYFRCKQLELIYEEK